jgi:hypothetical protein
MFNPQHPLSSPSGSSGVGNALPLQAHLALDKTVRIEDPRNVRRSFVMVDTADSGRRTSE